MICNACGVDFDPADLSQVGNHEHAGLALPAIRGKRVINHARDVYPGCSGEFASGVHSYLNGLEAPTRPCSDELIQGYYCAERDLQDNYSLNKK